MNKETGGAIVLLVAAFLVLAIGATDAQTKDGVLNSPHARFTGTAGPASVQMNGDMSVTGNVTATSFIVSGGGLTGMPGTAISDTSITGNQLQGNAATSPKMAGGAVIPAKISFYGNVRIVAKTGGDFPDPYAAMSTYSSWCPTPSIYPCLLKIMPGVYDVGSSPVVMQPYIDIEGSGENTTIIQGSIESGSAGVVNGTNNAEIRFLTVNNAGGGTNSIALYNASASFRITSVIAAASGSAQSYGVYNGAPGAVKITNSIIKGTTSSIYNISGAKAFVGNTQLEGGAVFNAGTLTCAGAYNGSYAALGASCQ